MPYQCDICEQNFVYPSGLKKHKNRKYPCVKKISTANETVSEITKTPILKPVETTPIKPVSEAPKEPIARAVAKIKVPVDSKLITEKTRPAQLQIKSSSETKPSIIVDNNILEKLHNVYKCKICHIVFENEEILKIHNKTSHSNNIQISYGSVDPIKKLNEHDLLFDDILERMVLLEQEVAKLKLNKS